jgi:alkane 1-monooxygenase
MTASPQWRFLAVLALPAGLALTVWSLSAWSLSAWSLSPWSISGATHLNPTFFIALAPLLSIHLALPLLDALFGDDASPAQAGAQHPLNAVLPMLCLPAWLAVLLASAQASLVIGGATWWALAASAGATGGIVAINVGHELIHRPTRLQRLIGGLLLSSVGYGVFKVEHVRGHHLRVATPEDGASAPRGEGLWHFVPRSVVSTFGHAWTLESQRLARRYPSSTAGSTWRRVAGNEALAWILVSLMFAMAIGLSLGIEAILFWALASAFAILELEIINYIEHYGLQRQRKADGRYEAVEPRHSWNANTALVNAFLLNLQRHSDHHAHGAKPYVALGSVSSAPQMPAGYGAMVMLALVPPLWRSVMDARLDRYQESTVAQTTGAETSAAEDRAGS